MKILRPLLYLLLFLVGAFLLFLLYATIDDYKPHEINDQAIECEPDILIDSLQIKLEKPRPLYHHYPSPSCLNDKEHCSTYKSRRKKREVLEERIRFLFTTIIAIQK